MSREVKKTRNDDHDNKTWGKSCYLLEAGLGVETQRKALSSTFLLKLEVVSSWREMIP